MTLPPTPPPARLLPAAMLLLLAPVLAGCGEGAKGGGAAGDARRQRVRGRDRLRTAADGNQCRAAGKYVHTAVCRRKRVIRGQAGQPVRTGEVDRTRVAGDGRVRRVRRPPEPACGRRGGLRGLALRLAEHLLALFQREQRCRLLRVADDRHDDVVEVASGALDDVEVAERFAIDEPLIVGEFGCEFGRAEDLQREDFEAVRDMAQKARQENEALAARVAALEAEVAKLKEVDVTSLE